MGRLFVLVIHILLVEFLGVSGKLFIELGILKSRWTRDSDLGDVDEEFVL